LLLRGGANVNHQNEDGGTALMGAAYHGRASVVRRLLRADADAGMRDWQADTALKLAQRQGHTACVESLKEHVAAEMGDASSGEAATHASNAGGELSGYAMHERILQKYVRDWQAGLSEEKRARFTSLQKLLTDSGDVDEAFDDVARFVQGQEHPEGVKPEVLKLLLRAAASSYKQRMPNESTDLTPVPISGWILLSVMVGLLGLMWWVSQPRRPRRPRAARRRVRSWAVLGGLPERLALSLRPTHGQSALRCHFDSAYLRTAPWHPPQAPLGLGRRPPKCLARAKPTGRRCPLTARLISGLQAAVWCREGHRDQNYDH